MPPKAWAKPNPPRPCGRQRLTTDPKEPLINTSPSYPPQTVLGLDYGIKKMGMALGNTLTKDAQPFEVLAMNNGQPDWDNLLGIIEAWHIGAVVVGLPLNMDGSDSVLSKRAAKFARRLAHRLGERHMTVQVFLSDERLTSQSAKSLLTQRGLPTQNVDAYAACLIVQDYFSGNPPLPVHAYQNTENLP